MLNVILIDDKHSKDTLIYLEGCCYATIVSCFFFQRLTLENLRNILKVAEGFFLFFPLLNLRYRPFSLHLKMGDGGFQENLIGPVVRSFGTTN